MEKNILNNFKIKKLFSNTKDDNFKKGFSFDDSFIAPSFENGYGFKSDINPLVENIYNCVAKDVSNVKFAHKIVSENQITYNKESDVYKLLNIRPNELQTPREFIYTAAYQLVKYGNCIIIPSVERYSDKNIVDLGAYGEFEIRASEIKTSMKSLEIVDIDKMVFGFGYTDIDDEKYLIMKSKVLTSNGKIVEPNEETEYTIIKYSDIIHIRYNPNNVFNCDQFEQNNLTEISDLFNTNINQMLLKMNNSGKINGIVKMKGVSTTDQTSANRVKSFTNTFMKKNNDNIAVISTEEDFIQLNKTFEAVSKDDIDTVLDYLYKTHSINPNIVNGNYTEAEYNAFYQSTILPIINRFEEEFGYKLLGVDKMMSGESIVSYRDIFALTPVSQLSKALKEFVYDGSLSNNEARSILNFEPYEGGDVYRTNLNARDIDEETKLNDQINEQIEENNEQNGGDK